MTWRQVPLGKVCKIVGGSTPSSGVERYWGGDIIWVTPTDLGRNEDIYISGSERRITREGCESCGSELVPADSVVMSSRAPIGHLAIARVELCTNQGCKTFVPSGEVDSLFLFFALRYAMPEIRELGSGATFSEVSKSQLEAFEISLPNVAEQKRIAAILNEQMAAVEKARAAAEARLSAATSFWPACLRSVFFSSASVEWRSRKLGDIAEIVGGIQKTPDRAPRSFFRPYLTVRNVQRGFLDLSQTEEFEVTPDELKKLRLVDRDILIVEGNGSIDHIGRNALFIDDGEEWIHQNHIIRVRLDRSVCTPDFVSCFLNSEAGRKQMIEKARTSSGLYTLSAGKVSELDIPVPPVATQAAAIVELNQRRGIGQSLMERAKDGLRAIEALPSVLLRRAFSGEL